MFLFTLWVVGFLVKPVSINVSQKPDITLTFEQDGDSLDHLPWTEMDGIKQFVTFNFGEVKVADSPVLV